MFEVFVDRMRERGIHAITGVSANPTESAQRYGIAAVQRIGGWDSSSPDRLDRVTRTAQGTPGLLADDDPAHAVIAAIRASDGVAISGGGNLSSVWPLHIYERGAIGRIASALGKPLVVSGQTIGPVLTGLEEPVRELLASARMVGLREPASFQLCQRLGVPEALLEQTVDDASFLVDAPVDTADYCLVTLANHVGDADRAAYELAVAGLLDSIASDTGLEIVFGAHFASTDPSLSRGDSVMHDRVAALMTAPVRVAPTTDSVGSATLARNAAFVVSSRYHPVVFAVPAGVPAIGISVDSYTHTKLTGALGNFGQESVLPSTALLAGDGPALAARVWQSRADIRERGVAIADDARRASAAHWDAVAAVLGA